MKENNALDFDDLLIYPLEIFKDHPRSLGKYRKKCKYILVYEYQYTHRAQLLLVKILAEKLFGPLEVPEVGYQYDQEDETKIIEPDDETRMWW